MPDHRTQNLDFTAHGMLPGDLLKRLDELALEKAGSFNAMIAQLSRPHARDVDWWVTRPATRNTHVSALFTRCMQISLAQELRKAGVHVTITVDDAVFARVLRKGGFAVSARKMRGRVHRLRTNLHNMASSIWNSLAAAAAARSIPASSALKAHPLFAVEEGVNETSFTGGRHSDHYYPDLKKAVSETDAHRHCIIPMFYRVKSYRRLFALMRDSETPFLIREHYLSFADYLFAFGHWWRARKFLPTNAVFSDMQVGPLVDADILEGRFSNSALQALLSYRFWLNIDRYGIKVAKLLDWYEGHDRDHATAAAISWHHLPIRHVAYRHLTGPQYLSAIPAQHEIDAGVVPRIFAAVGRRASADMQASLSGITIFNAPSLRFARLGGIARKPAGSKPQILVLLGLEAAFLRSVSSMITPAFTAPELRDISWILRRHPLAPDSLIQDAFGTLPGNVRFAESNFRTDLEQANIAMGIATNALAEARLSGIPVISLAAGNEPIENPIPAWMDRAQAGICYDARELPPLILAMLATAGNQTDGEFLREEIAGPQDISRMRDALDE